MFLPWFVFWAPQYHFPWSGSVAQQIEPTLSAFFNGIPAESGDKYVERGAFEIASYGKQLGWLTEAVLGMADEGKVSAEQRQKALKSLQDTRVLVEKLKEVRAQVDFRNWASDLEGLQKDDPVLFDRLMQRFGGAS